MFWRGVSWQLLIRHQIFIGWFVNHHFICTVRVYHPKMDHHFYKCRLKPPGVWRSCWLSRRCTGGFREDDQGQRGFTGDRAVRGCFFFWHSRKMDENDYLGGGNSNMFLFSPRKLGKWSILTSIFFRWVEPPTSYLLVWVGGLDSWIPLGKGFLLKGTRRILNHQPKPTTTSWHYVPP